ncbi:MAG: phosphodiester glycosidase family protein [Mogibacterium sp.]|nr:phosphodiester glycosidase family protein [Mogibacterium sp.]
MKRNNKKQFPKQRILAAYMALLLVFTTYVALDTFVITRVYGDAANLSSEQENDSAQSGSDSDIQGSENIELPDTNSGEDETSSQESSEHKHGGKHKPDGSHGPGSHKKSVSTGSSDQSGSSGSAGSSDSDSSNSSSAVSTASDSYSDSNISISLKEYRQNDTTIYVADVTLSSPEYLKTALAQGVYGKNVTDKTSSIASDVSAILAINGDFYGTQEKGYVIRNGQLYRSAASNGSEDLVIYKDGSFEIINESEVTAEQLVAKGAVQTLSFGPALIENGSIAVTADEEVGKAMASNPRTAIGIIDDCHYVFVVSDGRSDASEGLSLYELAEFMESLGVETAYNLDGGGSSTMYFKGSVVNNPTSGGNIKERSVSDIVYIGY